MLPLDLMQVSCNNIFMVTENIVNILRKRGLRITQPRIEILEALGEELKTVEEIKTYLLKKRSAVDLVTIYRNLELLVDLGIVNKVLFEDKVARFEIIKMNHHHHLVCSKCGDVEEIDLNEKRLLSQVKQKSNFQILKHSLEFFGFCVRCQT